ncbi:MAG: succinyldiaminopimelate transaminase [Gammaproteobacteria bacterium]|nr:succinyldiaminopimelate transaminase [Gammaproteobacteria bacterium]
MNPDLARLQPYPFERLRALRADLTPPEDNTPIALSIGEPKHPPPPFVLEKLREYQDLVSIYPSTKGRDDLRQAIADWLQQRFALTQVDADRQVLPVNGTREALFAFAQCIADRSSGKDLVLMPNPFYQIYEGAALLAGLTPAFYNTTAASAYAPDFEAIADDTWRRCQLVYICTPGNPSGAVISEQALQTLIEKAEQFDFVIASDECYSEIFFDESKPPPGLLQAAANAGNTDYRRCVVFHSLSKRSNLPGLRSGFVAGDADILKKFLLYRTYHGCSMPEPTQLASKLAWQDEEHVRANRRLYAEKFAAVLEILQPVLDVRQPDASFYLWPSLPVDDEHFTLELYRRHGISVLPGSYLSREADGINPGRRHVRIALVAELADCVAAAEMIKQTLASL